MRYKNNGSFHLPAALMLLAVFTLFSCKDKKAGSAETKNEDIEKPADTPGANNQPDYRIGSWQVLLAKTNHPPDQFHQS